MGSNHLIDGGALNCGWSSQLQASKLRVQDPEFLTLDVKYGELEVTRLDMRN